MRNLIFLLLICVSFSNLIVAQQYFSFPDSNAVWYVEEAECCPIYELDNYQVVFKRDTIIHGKQYHIIGKSNTKTDYAIREDSTKKVWVIYLDHLVNYNYSDQQFPCGNIDSLFNLGNDSTEYLLYDFNLNINDTVTIYYPKCNDNLHIADGPYYYQLVVIWIDSIRVLNDCRKLFVLQGISEFPLIEEFKWVEGIGASTGPIYPETTPFFEHGWGINRFDQNGDTLLYYPYFNGGDCLVDVPKIDSNEIDIKIYPNPTDHIIIITNNDYILKETKISILNITGQQIMSEKYLNQNSVEINVNELAKGIYMIKIQVDNKINYRKLIIE